jgi:hypothetical protein
MQGLPPNTPDWIRAQDIALTSQNEIAESKGKKRR